MLTGFNYFFKILTVPPVDSQPTSQVSYMYLSNYEDFLDWIKRILNYFQPPLPAPVWEKPYDAINKNIICPQYTLQLYDSKPKNSVEQEDCLIANVYVPDTRKTNISVLVYVHGGGFFGGYGDFLTPKRLLKSKDIVLVTFNYRLGVHGFLCLGTENVPGNAGMKDQIALLRWVQKNIESYGGNPNDVTIAGYSAGSMSVDLLMLSKSAEGLFHKVIPESGGNLATYTIQRDPLEVAQYQAKLLNFTNIDDIHALEEFYRTTPLEQLYYTDILSTRFFSSALFSPCVERETEAEAFLTESPLSILQKGSFKKLPVLYGFAAMEGRGRLAFFEMLKPKMNQNFSDFLPNDLKFDSEKERREVSDKVKKFYFGDKPVGEDNKLGFANFFTDVTFSHAMLWAVKLYAEAGHNGVYLYEYSFVDENVPLVPPITIRGADHCDQTFAVMDSLDEDLASVEVKNMKKTMRQIWHNFIKTG